MIFNPIIYLINKIDSISEYLLELCFCANVGKSKACETLSAKLII